MLRTICFLMILFLSHIVCAKNIITGIVEASDVNKNTFLCPAGATSSKAFCLGQAVQFEGFDISPGHTVMICNNQQYWMQQKTDQEQYIMQGRNYQGSQAESMMASQGWGAMGSYVLLITADPMLTDFLLPKIIVGANQIKVVVQLWYNGNDVIQLWSQDVIALSVGQNFTIHISSALDNRLPTFFEQKNVKRSWQDTFLTSLQLQPDNRVQDAYASAKGSPRTVRIAGL